MIKKYPTLESAVLKANAAWRAAKAAEKCWRLFANARTPEEWRKAIDGISDKTVRIQVACIVWWDYFSQRPADNQWTHLDDYKAKWKPSQNANVKKVREALMQIGYPERFADMRGNVSKPDVDPVTGSKQVVTCHVVNEGEHE